LIIKHVKQEVDLIFIKKLRGKSMSPITITLIILAFMTVMFVTEKLPLAVTAMLSTILLVLTGILDPNEAFAGFVNSNVILFVAMFIVGAALFQTGMASKVGSIVTKFAKTERQLIFSVMLVVGLLSSVLSNTGTAAVLLPVVIGISAKSGFRRSRLLLPLIFAAAIGGNISLIGAPGNMIANSAMQQLDGSSFEFFEFAKIGIPMLIGGIIYFVTFGYKLLPDRETEEEYEAKEKDYSDVPKWKQNTALIVMIATVLAMVFEDQIGIKLYISGAVGALILVITGVMSEKQAYQSIDMSTIFLFGGTLPMATALEKTGAGAYIANNVASLLGSNPQPIVMLIVLFLVSCVMTNFMSNTATTALLVPIGVSIAQSIGADPKAVLVAIVIGGSCAYATPMGMPANTMVYGPGGYKFNDYVKAGLPLILVSFIISVVLIPIFYPFF
jgi:solute carrier family 13 (sodium-dependent dicarboxylate transporter), member 2/3/5